MKKIALLALPMLLLPIAALAQGERTTTRQLHCSMTPSKEVPVVTADAAGNCVIEIIARRDASNNILSATVDFRIDIFLGQAETFTGLHIHRAAEGVNGPVVINSGLRTRPGAAGENRLFYQVAVTDPAQIAIVAAVMANPAAYYCNIHTDSNRGGIARGQLTNGPATQDAVVGVATQIAGGGERVATLQAAVDSLTGIVRQIAFRLGIALQ